MDINELAKLEFLSGTIETMDGFTMLYERLLTEVQAIEDQKQRRDQARRMQRILMKQAEFLMNQWLKEKRAAPNSMRLLEYGKNN